MASFKKTAEKQFPSELRFDIASEHWVVIATGRGKRPESFRKEKKASERAPKKDCPFCQINTQKTPTTIFSHGKKIFLDINGKVPRSWTTIAIPNKYPAFMPAQEMEKSTRGNLYQTVNAVGYHEVIVTKDHDKHIALMRQDQVKELIDVYQKRYLELMKKPFVSYVAIFHNHGREAGASIYHPHSQIITTPLIEPDLKKALINSGNYFKEHGTCLYCEMNKWEKKVKERLVFENDDFLVVCPFASKMAFQTIISPKKHSSHFKEMTEKEKENFAEALRVILRKIHKGLNNPAYNFYIHTAPCNGEDLSFYHWHLTILPKTAIHAGFELGVGIEISTIEPEKATEYLRKY